MPQRLGEPEPCLGPPRALGPPLQVVLVVRRDLRPVARSAQEVADEHLGVGADDRVARDLLRELECTASVREVQRRAS